TVVYAAASSGQLIKRPCNHIKSGPPQIIAQNAAYSIVLPRTPMSRIIDTIMTEDQFKRLLEQNNAQLLVHFDKRLDEQLEQNNAVLFGQLSKYFDERVKEVTGRLDKHDTRFDQVIGTLDSLSKDMEAAEQERTVINHQLDRHAGWIGQLARATNAKLIPEQ